jgi:hypothetical protein
MGVLAFVEYGVPKGHFEGKDGRPMLIEYLLGSMAPKGYRICPEQLLDEVL